MANAIVSTLIFNGSIAGTASIQSQGIAGNLTLQLPNVPPIQGQLMTATAINGTTVVLGWSSAQSLSNIPLSALAQSGATSGQIIEWNGSAWVPSTTVPGSGTVTSVALTVPGSVLAIAGSPITGAGTLAVTLQTQSPNQVWAGPTSGGAATPTFRALVAADIGASIVTIAAINSKVGNGNAVQLSNTGQTYNLGDAATFDANGNTVDNSILNLNAHAILVSPAVVSITGTTGIGIINQTSGDIAITQNGSGNFSASSGTGTLTLTGPNASSILLNNAGMLLTPGSGQATTIRAPRFSGQVLDNAVSAAAHTGQLLAASAAAGNLVWSDSIQVNGIAAVSGSDLTLSAAGSNKVEITTATGVFDFFGTGGGMSLQSQNASIAIDVSGNVQITAATGETASISGQTVVDNSGGTNIALTVHGNSTADIARFEHSNSAAAVQVTNAGDLFLRNHLITDNTSVAGVATITNPATTQAVVYDTPFLGTTAPQITVTAVGADPSALGGVWITNQGGSGNWTGFTINVTTTPSVSATFNYHVIGS